jgi:N-acetyl-anhydromuramyl-L-alanine amidase AmpD
MENVGFLRRAPDGVGYVDGYGGRYRGAPPVKTSLGWFEPYTTAQIAALADVARAIVREAPILHDGARWVGHSDVQPGKSDPGPLFPWDALRALVAKDGAP